MTRRTPQSCTPHAAYATALSALLGPQGRITPEYYEAFGQELAEMQEPPRAIPYHDFTIAGWAKGELLPTPQAQQALATLLADEYSVPEATLEALDELHDMALDWQAEQTSQPSELSHALKHALTLSGKSQTAITNALAEKNARWNAARDPNADTNKIANLGVSKAGLSYVLGGHSKNSPSKLLTYTLEQLCKPPFSLRAIHENSLRERADQLWATAAQENDLGGLIHACRVRLGEHMKPFTQRIGTLAGIENFGTSTTCFNWENNECIPNGDSHHTNTLYEPIVQAMKLADTAKNGLSLSIQTPWFDAEKEKTFRQIFTQAVTKANEGMFTSELPSTTAVECPDPKPIPADLRIYDGKLNNTLTNGRPRE